MWHECGWQSQPTGKLLHPLFRTGPQIPMLHKGQGALGPELSTQKKP